MTATRSLYDPRHLKAVHATVTWITGRSTHIRSTPFRRPTQTESAQQFGSWFKSSDGDATTRPRPRQPQGYASSSVTVAPVRCTPATIRPSVRGMNWLVSPTSGRASVAARVAALKLPEAFENVV